jgi:pantothenate kinase
VRAWAVEAVTALVWTIVSTFRSVDALAAHIAALPATPRARLVGITGPPGVGKSTVAASLTALLGAAALLPLDGYHYSQAHLVSLGRRERMGAPDTFDVEGFLATLRELRAGRETVFAPGFDREIEEAVSAAIALPPELATVVVEGNYLLLDSGLWSEVAPLLDETVFVDLDDGIRQSRLIERHVRFGKSEADARAWALGPDESNARVIAATRSRAQHYLAL